MLVFLLLCVVGLASSVQITKEEFHAYTKKFNLTEKVVNPCEKWLVPNHVPCELHQIETEDGFKLLAIHLPNHYKTKSVIFQHGLMGSCNGWLLGDNTATSFAQLTWTAGFDVWVTNSRGNEYSLEKKGSNPDEDSFWDAIDWDYMAKYDIPANVNYVHAHKPENKIAYVGHSQGTVQMFAALSENYGAIQDKLSLVVAMAPVAAVGGQSSQEITSMVNMHLDSLLNLFGLKAFPPFNTDAVEILKKLKCKCQTNEAQLCDNTIYDISGATPEYISKATLDLLGYIPSTTSIRNLQHWMQAVRSGKFQKFNYGLIGNLVEYGSAHPPIYDPKQIKKVPLALYSGGKDELADPRDVAWLVSQLETTGLLKVHKQIPEYQHNDFLWATSALKLIWEEVLSNIESL